ncbi:MAG: sulfurtransferase [Woeseiaceae bacterium]|nr:sulfurtransferase [Woeseiaceae bacterium]
MFDTLISAGSLHRNLGSGGLRIVDCRFDLLQPDAGRARYLEAHIPDAVYAHLDEDLSGPVREDSGRHPLPDAAEQAQTFGRLGIDNNSQVVVYDDVGGMIAARAWWLLRWLGHRRVALLDGDWSHWVQCGFATESGQAKVAPASFDGRPQQEMVIETADLVDVGAGGVTLVDARDRDRFRGVSEPIDPVAGHVPGALNLPCAANLNERGTWKGAAELRELWKQLLGRRIESPVSVMCGSGVTACHLALSGYLAGLGEPSVYVGSWSEWIRDAHRPIATG